VRINRRLIAFAAAGALMSSLSPMSVQAATYPMRTTKIELNSMPLSNPSGFTYQQTTFMPLYYVQQLLNKLQIVNTWDGTTWNITTPFPNQPTFTLKTNTGPMGIVVNQKGFALHVNKVVTIDPASHKNTTFIPIWYIKEALQAVGLTSDWSGTVWNVQATYTAYDKTGKLLGVFTNLSDAETALLDFPGGEVKDDKGNVVFTEDSFKNVDLRYPAPANLNAATLNAYLSSHSTIMAGLGQVFMDAEQTYGVDANYLVSHAIEETGSNGNFSSIAQAKNNLYGYGAYDANAASDAGTFPSEAYAILFQAWEVRNNYLNPGASNYTTPTLDGMAQNYASDPNWANKVNNLMDQLAIDLNDNITSYEQYSPANQPVPPAGSAVIPVYLMNGAMGTVTADPYYGVSVPVFTDGGAGHQHMFVRELQLGDQGDDVQTLQKALNGAENAGLTTDGIFGAKTQSALIEYQSAHGLAPTGVCDFQLWNDILNLTDSAGTVSSSESVSIDGIVEGMAGGAVTEWYHIANLGWVNASDVNLTNVYRVTVPSLQSATGVNVAVTDAAGNSVGTLHAGDYVVSANPSPVSGKIAVQFVSATSAPVSGYMNATDATLTQVSH
jgi:mannosyl-glycoprotein endo-beta-N-acetylglucosaminidase